MTNAVLQMARSVAKKAPPPITEMVPMRDGVCLATDVYLPGEGTAWPVIVERTPYNRRGVSNSEIAANDLEPLTRVEIANFYRDLGFAVVMQDVRGRHGSDGRFAKYVHEADDGYDSFDWITQQDWCDARICTIGLSYGAHTQIAAACAGAPGIAAMMIDTGGLVNAMKHSLRCGGAFELKQLTWMLRHAEAQARALGQDAVAAEFACLDVEKAVFQSAWSQGTSPLAPMPDYEASLFDMWDADGSEPEWQSPATCAERWMGNFPDVPVCLLGSWNDPYASSMWELHRLIEDQVTRRPTMVFGPWLHGKRSLARVGDVDFGAQSTLDAYCGMTTLDLRARWLRHALDGAPNPLPRDVNIFQMGVAPQSPGNGTAVAGTGAWLSSDALPITETIAFYAEADGGLRPTQCALSAKPIELISDPKDPFPTLGGAVTSGGDLMQGGMFRLDHHVWARGITKRPDAMVFSTDPLLAPISIFGSARVTATLVGCDGPFDLVAWLCHRQIGQGNETVINVADGIKRWTDPADQIFADLICTGFTFEVGSIVDLIVTTANFPRFDLAGGTRMPGSSRGRSTSSLNLAEVKISLPVIQAN